MQAPPQRQWLRTLILLPMRHGTREDEISRIDHPDPALYQPHAHQDIYATVEGQVMPLLSRLCPASADGEPPVECEVQIHTSPFRRTRQTADELYNALHYYGAMDQANGSRRRCHIGQVQIIVDCQLCEVYGPEVVKNAPAGWQLVDTVPISWSGYIPQWGETRRDAHLRFVRTFQSHKDNLEQLYCGRQSTPSSARLVLRILVTHGDGVKAMMETMYPESTMWECDVLGYVAFVKVVNDQPSSWPQPRALDWKVQHLFRVGANQLPKPTLDERGQPTPAPPVVPFTVSPTPPFQPAQPVVAGGVPPLMPQPSNRSTQRIAQLEHDLTGALRELATAKQQLERAHSDRKDIAEQTKRLRSSNAKHEKAQEEVQNLNAALRIAHDQEMTLCEREKQTQEAENRQNRQKLQAAEERVAAMRRELETEKQRLEQRLGERTAESQRLDQRLQQRTAESQRLEQDLQQRTGESQRLQQRISQLQNDRDEWHTKYDTKPQCCVVQ